tara:strand:- start:994 stop:1185 length:192 start_codon:yes stop_codon:yes gene_type:complete
MSFRLRFKAPNKLSQESVKKFHHSGGLLHIDNNGIGYITLNSKSLEIAKENLKDILGEEVEYV